jgi:heat shock transcription factor 2
MGVWYIFDFPKFVFWKVSSSKPEENKIRQEDLTKIISSAQKVQIKQETIESRLSELKR